MHFVLVLLQYTGYQSSSRPSPKIRWPEKMSIMFIVLSRVDLFLDIYYLVTLKVKLNSYYQAVVGISLQLVKGRASLRGSLRVNPI